MNAWIRGVQNKVTPQPEVASSPGTNTSDVASSSTDIVYAQDTPIQGIPLPKIQPVQVQEEQEAQEDIPPLETVDDSDEEIEELSPPDPEAGGDSLASPLSDPQDFPHDVWGIGWGEFYLGCSVWKDFWLKTHDSTAVWPPNFKVFGERMYNQEKLCVPANLQEIVVQDHHSFLGHVGGPRLWKNMDNKFIFAKPWQVKKYVAQVTKRCPICEACARPRNLKGPLGSAMIPPQIMVSVALDFFTCHQSNSKGNFMISWQFVSIECRVGLLQSPLSVKASPGPRLLRL